MTAAPPPATPPDGPPETGTCRWWTRRRFLAALGASVATAGVAGFGIAVWGRNPAVPTSSTTTTLLSPPSGAAGPPTDRILVVVEMGGGNDGLNTVVPYADPRYHDLRRDLAIGEPLVLDDEVGFHPALGFLAERWAAREVAIVEGVGYPDPDLSHFASMATWWSGLPGAAATTGWLGRYLDGTVGMEDPLAGVVIGPGPTPALLGERSFAVTVQDMTGLAPRVPPWIDSADELVGMWQGFAPAAFDGAMLLDTVRAAIGATVRAKATLDDALDDAPDYERPDGLEGNVGRRSDLVTSLEVAAALVASPSPPTIIYVHGWGDFDTHEGETERHGQLMATLDGALRAFFGSIEAAGVADRVLLMTTSEFGRRPAYNGSGTDHGTAAAHLLVGRAVAGGRYGEPLDLARLDSRGNPVHTVDYRSLYATVIGGWMEADAESVLGGDHETLDLLLT